MKLLNINNIVNFGFLLLTIALSYLYIQFGQLKHVQPTNLPETCTPVTIPNTSPTQQICMYSFASSKQPSTDPTLVLIHGFSEYALRYKYSIEYFQKNGFNVIALDSRGHGYSSGVRNILNETAMFEDWEYIFKTKVPKDRATFIFTHSMGGMFLTRFAQTHNIMSYLPSLKGVINAGVALQLDPSLASPFLQQIVKLLGSHFPALPVQKLESETVSRDPQVRAEHAVDPLINPSVHAATGLGILKSQKGLQDPKFSTDYSVPALLAMHGGDDKIIPSTSSEWLIEHATGVKDRTLKIWDGLYHELVNEPEKDEVLHYMLQWIQKRL